MTDTMEIPEKKQQNPGITIELSDGESSFFINTPEGSYKYPITTLWPLTLTFQSVCRTLETEGKLVDGDGKAVRFSELTPRN